MKSLIHNIIKILKLSQNNQIGLFYNYQYGLAKHSLKGMKMKVNQKLKVSFYFVRRGIQLFIWVG